MPSLSRFEIKGLHGRKNVDLRLENNTLILVGENGSGKTTILHLLYYLLSGQWTSIAKYRFSELAITLNNKRHLLKYSDINVSLKEIDHSVLRRLPSSIRHRILELLEEKEGDLVASELEVLCHQFDIPLSILLHQIDLFQTPKKKSDTLRKSILGIRNTLDFQLLYLPTYRRIEQELNLIFKGLDDRELRQRRELLSSRRESDTFVELIEFGMKDVDNAINKMLSALNTFARENLNDLTFGYLRDIVEGQYSTVDLESIKGASEDIISSILNRIQEHILSTANKKHLREIINQVQNTNAIETEHTKVVCHYFAKLLAFQKELEAKESQITNFCRVCNEYMVDKEFVYDTSRFTFTIRCIGDVDDAEIKLHHLSSGEKQIVSLFSHLYLSGGHNYFVLIDEPELSLSVPWQRRFLIDIRNGGYCSGLVAVTHSPFIYDNELQKYARGLGEFVL